MSEEKLTLQEKVEKYEELLSEIMGKAVKREGVVIAGPDMGYYRLKMGGEEIISKSPLFKLKINQSVIVVDGMVVEKLPEGLKKVEEEEVEYQRIKWSDIGGMKSQIDAIKKKIEYPILHERLFKEFNLASPKGIALYGPTGCGKTLVAKAIASTLFDNNNVTNKSFVYIKGGELLSKYVGETEQKIKRIFDSARVAHKKTGVRSIIFIDEAEAILPRRGSRISSDVETTIVPTFLSEMDGFESDNPFIILATNYLERIDDAILRSGRIDMKIYIGRPDHDDTTDIFKIHLGKRKVYGNIDKLAKEAADELFRREHLVETVSGALIEGIVNLATENAIVRKIKDRNVNSGIIMEDIIFSMNNH